MALSTDGRLDTDAGFAADTATDVTATDVMAADLKTTDVLATEPTSGERVRAGGTVSAMISRLGIGGTHLAAIIATLAAGLAVSGVVAYAARPESEPVEPQVAATGTPITGDSPERSSGAPSTTEGAGHGEESGVADDPSDDSAATGEVVVHVAGSVAEPGVITLPAGSRVVDAITAAGGAQSGVDLSPLNLARVLADGEQVLVGVDPPAGSEAVPGGGADEGSGVVNLNTSSASDLETLPGIGPALAQRILDWRTEHGRFTTVDELREIKGIGESTFAELAALVTV